MSKLDDSRWNLCGSAADATVVEGMTCNVTKCVWVLNSVTEEVSYTTICRRVEAVPCTDAVIVNHPETCICTVP